VLYDFYILVRDSQTRQQALNMWTIWALVTTVGWLLAGFSGLPLGRAVVVEGSTDVILSVALNMGLLGALIGGLIGTSQWYFLRRRVRLAGWWVVATALGWGVGLLVALLLNLLAGLGLCAGLYGVVIGLAVGTAQWLVLRQTTPQAGKWIWVTVVALPVGIAFSGVIESGLLARSSGGLAQARWLAAFAGGMAGLLVGAITGMTLVALLSGLRKTEA